MYIYCILFHSVTLIDLLLFNDSILTVQFFCSTISAFQLDSVFFSLFSQIFQFKCLAPKGPPSSHCLFQGAPQLQPPLEDGLPSSWAPEGLPAPYASPQGVPKLPQLLGASCPPHGWPEGPPSSCHLNPGVPKLPSPLGLSYPPPGWPEGWQLFTHLCRGYPSFH